MATATTPNNLAALLQEKREDILRIAEKHGASNVRVFGSVAHGEARPDSDADFLVEIQPIRSLMDISGMVADLQGRLGHPVDLAEPEGLHQLVREKVLEEAVYL